jgi:hypothetical protein
VVLTSAEGTEDQGSNPALVKFSRRAGNVIVQIHVISIVIKLIILI